MNLKQRFGDVFIKFYYVLIYYFAVLFVTGYIGTYTLGLLMSSDAETGFDPAMIVYMILVTFYLWLFGWPAMLIAAGMYTVLFPFMARLSLRFFGPVLPIVVLVAFLQARHLEKQFGDLQGTASVVILTVAIAIPTHLITLLLAYTYNGIEPDWIAKRSRAGDSNV